MIVVDASALTEILLRGRGAGALEDRVLGSGQALRAPHLVDIEVAHVIRRLTALGVVDHARGRAALQELSTLPLKRYPHADLLARIWELRANLTAYDAAYVALAEALDAPLVTRDRRLAASPGHSARIELV